MPKQILTSAALSRPSGVFSQATMVVNPSRMIFVSGLTARDPATGKINHAGDVRAQTRQILEGLKAILAEGGATLEDVVKVTVFVRSIGDFAAIHEIRRQYFPKDPPASSMVEVSGLVEDDMLIEIEAIAVVGD
jgi:2-iminobutanoate/2-iminopropanoate deaminase